MNIDFITLEQFYFFFVKSPKYMKDIPISNSNWVFYSSIIPFSVLSKLV